VTENTYGMEENGSVVASLGMSNYLKRLSVIFPLKLQ
jgi:hypothetical protein